MPGGSSLDRTPSVDVMKLYFCPLVARTFQPNGFLPIYEPLVNARRLIVTWRAESTVRIRPISELKIQTRGTRLPLARVKHGDGVILAICRGTAARADLGTCFSAHRSYRVDWTQAVAMFPHADHIENNRAA